MKKLIIALLSLFAFNYAWAGATLVEGSIDSIKTPACINLVIEYDNLCFLNMPEEDFMFFFYDLNSDDSNPATLSDSANASNAQLMLDKCKREWRIHFIEEANDQLSKVKCYAGYFPKSPVTAVVKVAKLTTKGFIRADIHFISDGITFAVVHVEENGGTFGSMSNLMGDGHKNAGDALGRLISSIISSRSNSVSPTPTSAHTSNGIH